MSSILAEGLVPVSDGGTSELDEQAIASDLDDLIHASCIWAEKLKEGLDSWYTHSSKEDWYISNAHGVQAKHRDLRMTMAKMEQGCGRFERAENSGRSFPETIQLCLKLGDELSDVADSATETALAAEMLTEDKCSADPATAALGLTTRLITSDNGIQSRLTLMGMCSCYQLPDLSCLVTHYTLSLCVLPTDPCSGPRKDGGIPCQILHEAGQIA